MFIWKATQLRCNPYARYTDEQGTQYVRVPQELYEEIPDPVRGNDEIEYTQEINEAPYVVITPKSQEQIDEINARKAKRGADRLALEEVKADAKFQNLISKTPAQAKNWVENNFPSLTLPEQKDLATLVIAIGILGRNL